MNIRQAVAADLDSIQACASAAYHKYIVRIGREPAPMLADFALQINQQQVYVAVDNDCVVAFAVCYPLDNGYFLENIAVHPASQGLGHGAALLEKVHTLAVPYGVVRLYTNEKMHENLTWYKNRGYKETARVHEDGFNRVYMEKTLQ